MADPEALADIGLIPEGEAVVEIPEDVLRFFEKREEVEDH